jgi:hypothetical protein
LDEVDDLFFGDCGLNRQGVVLQNTHQTLLDVLSVDVLGVFQEEVDPPRQVELVLAVSHHDLLKQAIDTLKDVGETHLPDSVHRSFRVVLDVLEPLIELENDLDEKFSGASVHQDLLDGRVGGVP